MPWLFLIVAGLLEVGWAIGLSYTEGFTKPLPTVLTVAAIVASMGLLGLAVRDLPIGTAYAVWVGIGATLTVVIAMASGNEPVSWARVLLILGLVGCIVGLKLVSDAGH